MKTNTPLELLANAAQDHHDAAESNRIARYILEDIYKINNLERQGELDTTSEIFQNIISQLKQGKPLQYITGISHFYGYVFQVDENVLIPRPETEELVYQILTHSELKNKEALSILDIGTGSGCIPISIKKNKPNWKVNAIDISKAALQVAAINAEKLQSPVTFSQLDILDENNWNNIDGNLDVIVSNPPYVSDAQKKEMSTHVLDFEPHIALFSGDDVLIFYKKITALATQKLKPNGWLFFELNEFFAAETKAILLEKGFVNVEIIKDMQGEARMLIGQI